MNVNDEELGYAAEIRDAILGSKRALEELEDALTDLESLAERRRELEEEVRQRKMAVRDVVDLVLDRDPPSTAADAAWVRRELGEHLAAVEELLRAGGT